MPSAVQPPRTLYDKVFQDHIVEEKDDGTVLLYIGLFYFAFFQRVVNTFSR
jgi:homoaconitase/3-isopropylmalate dehydratase large subunit